MAAALHAAFRLAEMVPGMMIPDMVGVRMVGNVCEVIFRRKGGKRP